MERLETIGLAAAFLAGGAGVGWSYFRLMRFSLQYLGRGRVLVMSFAGLAILRIALLCGGAVAAFYAGIWPFIAFTAGFLAARMMAVAAFRAQGETEKEPEKRVTQDG